MFEWIQSPEAWVALATLTALEIVLGIDNIIFISVLVGRLPLQRRQSARLVGLGLAMGTRILLLLSLAWLARLTEPLVSVGGIVVSTRDLILILGGLFLLFKATTEIHGEVENVETTERQVNRPVSYTATLVQIALVDIVFSLDSVITAVGMARDIPVMVIAVILAVLVMMVAAKPIGDFVDRHPTIKVLALSFLVMIGMALVAEGMRFHIPKPYIYTAMAFSVVVEMLNIRMRKRLSLRP